MTVRKTVGTVGALAQGAVSTAVSVVRHPIGTTAHAAGLVKGAAGAGVDLLRGTIGGTSPTPKSETPPAEAPAEPLAREAEAPEAGTREAESPEAAAPEAGAPAEHAPKREPEPEPELPGPDLAKFEPPLPEDLPEPIVIEADDAAPGNGESGEPFHNEPKATSRDSEHGAGPLDAVELDELDEDAPAVDEVQPRP